ncbi:hypothetical protein Pd630_LPD10012 (plasmid) [Rhodococcus opacus PD630]|nr:hypothetical protein Pd630_LPD10012 [Rhodococcus opacus PD630]
MSPVTLPMELARVVFASTMLDDVAKVVNMPEFDALVSLTHPEELVQQATLSLIHMLLDAHRSYASYPVDAAGDTATQWAVNVQQATQVAAYLLLDAHRSYASYPVDAAGDTATQWAVKWVTSKVQAAA